MIKGSGAGKRTVKESGVGGGREHESMKRAKGEEVSGEGEP